MKTSIFAALFFFLSATSASAASQVIQLPATSGGGGGGVTAVTATAPITSSGGTAPIIACIVATNSVAGCLSAADHTTFAAKQAALSFSAPLVNTANTISCTAASGSVPGCLAAADWTAFNGKQAALGFTPVNKAGDSAVGPVGFSGVAPGHAKLFVNNSTDDLDGGLVEGNSGLGGTQYWYHYINGGNGTRTMFNASQSHSGFSMGAAYGAWTGENTADYELEANYSTAETDTTLDPAVTHVPSVGARQTNATVGNYETMCLGNQAQASIACSYGVNENHSATGSQTGHVKHAIWGAGVQSTTFVENSDGTITIPPQAGGNTPSCAGGDAGKTAYTSAFVLCVCNGSGWVHASTGLTACTF